MISFFPAPYEDEILYSILARYHLRSGNTSYFTTNEDLYNEGIITSSIDLPSNNNILVENIPKVFGYTADEIIKKYTLFNYYTSFVDAHEKQLALEMLKGNDGRGVHSIVGAAQVSVKQQGYFKICLICYKEEIQDYGEAYLHRIHQIPEVFICSKHQVPLKISKQPIHYYGKNSYVPLLEIEFKENITNDLFTNNLKHFLAINKYIEYISSNEVSNKDYLWITDQYKNRLRELGLCTPSGRVKIDQVEDRFIKFYGEGFLKLFDLNIYSNNITNWIKYMLRISRSNVNPIKHLLLIRFLGMDLEEFFNKKIEYKPFGDNEWPCLNKLCINYLKPSIQVVTMSYNSHAKKPVGEFKCECGFTYLRIGPDLNEDDRYKIGKVKELGWLWENELIKLLKKGLSLNVIENRLNTSQKTIKNYAAKFGFEEYLNSRCEVREYLDKKEKEQLKEEKKNRKIGEFRGRWLKLREENPEKGANDLRLMDSYLNDYLLRYDRAWLYQHYPSKKKRITGGAVVDWDNKDEEVLKNVRVAVEHIKNSEGRPKKITVTLIGKKIGMFEFLLNNIDKLPKTKGFIENAIDTNKSYQIKKVQWSIQELIKEGEGVVWWRVYDKARLNEKEILEFKDELKILIYEYL